MSRCVLDFISEPAPLATSHYRRGTFCPLVPIEPPTNVHVQQRRVVFVEDQNRTRVFIYRERLLFYMVLRIVLYQDTFLCGIAPCVCYYASEGVGVIKDLRG